MTTAQLMMKDDTTVRQTPYQTSSFAYHRRHSAENTHITVQYVNLHTKLQALPIIDISQLKIQISQYLHQTPSLADHRHHSAENTDTTVRQSLNHTLPRSMIGCWHETVISLSTCLSVCL